MAVQVSPDSMPKEKIRHGASLRALTKGRTSAMVSDLHKPRTYSIW